MSIPPEWWEIWPQYDVRQSGLLHTIWYWLLQLQLTLSAFNEAYDDHLILGIVVKNVTGPILDRITAINLEILDLETATDSIALFVQNTLTTSLPYTLLANLIPTWREFWSAPYVYIWNQIAIRLGALADVFDVKNLAFESRIWRYFGWIHQAATGGAQLLIGDLIYDFPGSATFYTWPAQWIRANLGLAASWWTDLVDDALAAAQAWVLDQHYLTEALITWSLEQLTDAIEATPSWFMNWLYIWGDKILAWVMGDEIEWPTVPGR